MKYKYQHMDTHSHSSSKVFSSSSSPDKRVTEGNSQNTSEVGVAKRVNRGIFSPHAPRPPPTLQFDWGTVAPPVANEEDHLVEFSGSETERR